AKRRAANHREPAIDGEAKRGPAIDGATIRGAGVPRRRYAVAHLVRQAARMTARDWRAGELTMLVVALVLAVAALAGVGFRGDRLQRGLERDARRMIAADFVVRADHPVDAQFINEARALKLRTATTVIFPSMVARQTGAQSAAVALSNVRLAAVKAVS